jgi:CRP-like cAMP-binding protein
MSIEDDIRFFAQVSTLALLGREPLRILAIGAESRYVHGGDILFRTGESADAAFVVQEGSFRLASDAQNAAGVTVGPGALIGEMALLTETKRPVTATACEPSTVMRIPRTLFLKMLEGYPDAAGRLRDSLLARTEQATRDMRKVRGKLGGTEGGK